MTAMKDYSTERATRHFGMIFAKQRGQVLRALTEEYNTAQSIRGIEKLVRKIDKSNAIRFEDRESKTDGKVFCKPNRGIERDILSSLNDIRAIEFHYPAHRYNPYVSEFIRHAEALHLNRIEYPVQDKGPMDDHINAERMNTFVSTLKAALKAPAFKTLLSNHKRAVRKNQRSIQTYIDALFALHSRMLVLRIDLGYLNHYCDTFKSSSAITLNQAKEDRDRLLRDLKEKKILRKDSLLGYVWKLEYGLDKGYHHHCIFFLDGSLVREDVTIAKLIGEHWIKVTQDKGLYHNCNAYKDAYYECGIGMVSHDDQTALAGLNKAALYLTKVDYYIYMHDKGRCFGRGIQPKPKKDDRGRPRKYKHLQARQNMAASA